MARDDKVAFLASLNVTEHSARFKMTTFVFLKFFRDTMKSSEMPVQPFITPHVSNALLLNHLPPKMDTLFFPPNGLQNKIFFSLHFTFLWIFLASIIFWQRGWQYLWSHSRRDLTTRNIMLLLCSTPFLMLSFLFYFFLTVMLQSILLGAGIHKSPLWAHANRNSGICKKKKKISYISLFSYINFVFIQKSAAPSSPHPASSACSWSTPQS